MTSIIQHLELPCGSTTTLEQWGSSGPRVLLVHGIGSSRRDATRLGEALAHTHQVFAYDQRGHGDSADDLGSMRLDALAENLAYVAGHIGTIDLLIGHSWGGAVALLGGQNLASQLLLIDPLLRVPINGFDEYVEDLRPLLTMPIGQDRLVAISAEFATAHKQDREAKMHALQRMSLDPIVRLGRENRVDEGGWDLRSHLARPSCSLTLLLADEDSVVSATDLAEMSPQVVTERVVGHGHALHRSAFSHFVATVRELSPAA